MIFFLHHRLSFLMLLPWLGALIVLLIKNPNRARWVGVLWSILVLAAAKVILLPSVFQDPSKFRLMEAYPWISSLGAQFLVAVDGLSVLLILLTAGMTFLSALSAWKAIQERVSLFFALLLILEGAVFGVFCSFDLLLFYVFWDLMLIPMFLLIGIWGGEERVRAAITFFLYTFLGSVIMLVVILWIGYQYGTFSWFLLQGGRLTFYVQLIGFASFFLAFAVKVPLVPFHSWLPLAHVQAPTAGSVILASVMLKTGVYGFFRFLFPLFPDVILYYAPFVIWISIIGILYGAFQALAQTDMKKFIAYTSISHMGFIVLGLFVLNLEGLGGSVLQMINHGINTGALFLFIGILYERIHTRDLNQMGGFAKTMPVGCLFFGFAAFASLGLPGTNGFVGEILILIGTFRIHFVYGVVASLGVVLAAVYMLTIFKKVMLGPLSSLGGSLRDLDLREKFLMSVLLVFILWIGLHPAPILRLVPQKQFHHYQNRITAVSKKSLVQWARFLSMNTEAGKK